MVLLITGYAAWKFVNRRETGALQSRGGCCGVSEPPKAAPSTDSPLAQRGRQCWSFLRPSELEAVLLGVVQKNKHLLGNWGATSLRAGRRPRGNGCGPGVQESGMTSRNAAGGDELGGAELGSSVLGPGEKNTSLL